MTDPDVQIVEEILEGLREQTEDPEALHWVKEMEENYHAYLQAHYLNKNGYDHDLSDFDEYE